MKIFLLRSMKFILLATLLLFVKGAKAQGTSREFEGTYKYVMPIEGYSDRITNVPRYESGRIFFTYQDRPGPGFTFKNPAPTPMENFNGIEWNVHRAYYVVNRNGNPDNQSPDNVAFTFSPDISMVGQTLTILQRIQGQWKRNKGFYGQQEENMGSLDIIVQGPGFINKDAIKNVCNNTVFTISDYFTNVPGVDFYVDGTFTNKFNASQLSLGSHTISAQKYYDNGLYFESIQVNVIAQPTAVITASGSTDICEGSTITLSAPDAPAGQTFTYQWSSGETSKSIITGSPGDYTVVVANGSCSSVSPSIKITTKAVPSTYVTTTGNTNLCDGEEVVLTVPGAASYLWLKDGISTGINKQSIYISTGGSYKCIVTGVNGCSAETTPVVVTIKPNPKPTIAVIGSLTFCEGESVILSAEGGDGRNYNWSGTDGFSATGKSVVVTKSGVYTVTAINTDCQRTSDAIVVNVKPNPKPSITASGPTILCSGESVTLTATTARSYLWSTGETTKSIIATSSGNYSVTTTNFSDCQSTSDKLEVIVKPLPKSTIYASGSTSFCAGGSVTLIAGPGESWRWSNGATGQSIVVSQPGNYSVETFVNGCSAISVPTVVKINPTNVPVVTSSGTLDPCFGELRTLTSSDAISYLWSTGETSKSINVYNSGTYTVTTTNEYGCTATSQSTTYAYRPKFTPVITVSGNTTICDGESVTLTSTSGTAYRWSNGATTQSININSSGSYFVKVTNSEGCSSETETVIIKVNPRPKPIISVIGAATFCEGEQVVLTVSNPEPEAIYTWSTGKTGQSITAKTSGDYSVSVVYKTGCSAVSSVTKIVVYPIPKPTITASSESAICDMSSITLTVNEQAESYRWNTGETTRSINVTKAGYYVAYIKNKQDCERESDAMIISVKENKLASISVFGTTEFCEGDSVVLTSTKGSLYRWSNGEITRSITVKNTGIFNVEVINQYGCVSQSADLRITVYKIPKPTITITGPTTFCSGDSTLLTINETAVKYRWSNGATTKSIYVSKSGKYTGYIQNSQGCERETTPVDIIVYKNDPAVIKASGVTTFCESESVTLSTPLISGNKYKWSNGVVDQNTINVTESGNYYLTITNSSGCSSFTNTINVKVNPIPKPTLQIIGNVDLCQPDSVILVIKEDGSSYRFNNGKTGKSLTVKTSGTYIGYIMNAQGCERATDPITITVKENPVPTIIASGSTTFCEGQSIILSVPDVFGNKFLWNTGETTNTIKVVNGGNYYVTVTNQVNCSRTSAITKVIVNAIPKPTVTIKGNLDFCQPDSITLTIKETAFSYRWSNGATTKSIVVKETGSYIAYIQNKEGCERESDPIEVNVRENLPVNISASGKTIFCEGDSVKLFIPFKKNYTYNWNSGQSTNEITVKTSGNYYVKVTNDLGCEVISEIKAVTVHAIPKPTITVKGNLDFCQPDSVILTINEVGAAYRWSNGATTKSIVVKESGVYTGYLINDQGCERFTQPVTVTVFENSVPMITAIDKTNICEGDSVKLQVPLVPGYKYSWNNGANTNAITVKTSGEYFVSVTNNNNCTRTSAIKTVTVYPISKPTILIIGSTTFCEGDSVILTIKEEGYAYRWNNGAKTRSIKVRHSDNLIAFIQNSQGCERASDPITTTMNPNPIPTIGLSGKSVFCEGQSVKLSVPLKKNYQYSWNTGETTNEITVEKSGNYFVKVTNDLGCEVLSDVRKITVYPIPQPTLVIKGSLEFCQPDSLILTIKEVGAGYRWSNGATTKSITVKESGVYTGYLINEQGCERFTEPVTVNVFDNPTPIITAYDKTIICEGDSVKLQVPLIPGFKYSWNTGASTNYIIVKNSGDYFVTVTNKNNCARVSAITSVTVYPISKPTILITGSSTFCEGDSVILTIKEEGYAYRWSNGAKTRSITVSTSENLLAYIQNKEGCERVSDPFITMMKANPIPLITASGKTVICDGETVTLTSTLGTSYLWSNGATTRTIKIDAPGDYSVTVTNAQGCSRTSREVNVNVLSNNVPTIQSSLGSEFCSGYSTKLTASEGTFYRWNTGETTRDIIVSKSGNYTVTVINANDCSRTSQAYTVIVREPTLLKKVVDFETCINGGLITLDSKNLNTLGGNYTGTAVIGNVFNPSVSGLGTFKITYTYANEFGCISSTSFMITVVDITPLPIDPDIAICISAGKLLLLNSDLPVGVVASGTAVLNNSFDPAEAGLGKHIILYTYSNSSGCISTAKRVIEVVSTPTAPTVTGNTAGCDKSFISLRANASSIGNPSITYRWYKQGETEPFYIGQNITYQISGKESIFVAGKASNLGSCEGERTEVKIISYNPTGDFYAKNVTAIQGSAIEFVSEVTNGVSYLWEFGDGLRSTEANPKHYYNASGLFKVKLTAISSQGCYLVVEKLSYITILKDQVIINPPDIKIDPVKDPVEYKKNLVFPIPIKNGRYKVRIYNVKPTATDATLEIYGLDSRLLSKRTLSVIPGSNEIELNDVSELAKTWYLFVLTINNKSETFKVLIL